MNRDKLAVARLGNKINVMSLAIPELASQHIHLVEDNTPKEFTPPVPPKNTYGFNPFGVGGSSSFDGKRYDINVDLVGREIDGFTQYMWEDIRQENMPHSVIDFALDLAIKGELQYYKERFTSDVSFHEAIKANTRAYFKYTDILNRIEYIKEPTSVFIVHMWQLLSQMTIDGTYAFKECEIFKAISRNYPKPMTNKMWIDNNYRIAEQISKGKFSIKDIPLSTYVCHFDTLDIGESRERLWSKDAMMFINASNKLLDGPNAVLLLKFGFKHVVFVEMPTQYKYVLSRINRQGYKFKTLKKELGL